MSDDDDGLYFGDDFGQKVDLTVRIREILRNYPEGNSILKEVRHFLATRPASLPVRMLPSDSRAAALGLLPAPLCRRRSAFNHRVLNALS